MESGSLSAHLLEHATGRRRPFCRLMCRKTTQVRREHKSDLKGSWTGRLKVIRVCHSWKRSRMQALPGTDLESRFWLTNRRISFCADSGLSLERHLLSALLPRLCTYNAWFARPAGVSQIAIFRLPASNRCVRALLRFRLGCHNLPRDVGSRNAIPRAQRICQICHSGFPGDELHLVFECQGLQCIRDKYPHLFGQHARTMLQFIWQTDLHGVASFIADCLDVYHITDPEGGQASDQP